jgi:hypothetical protein
MIAVKFGFDRPCFVIEPTGSYFTGPIYRGVSRQAAHGWAALFASCFFRR